MHLFVEFLVLVDITGRDALINQEVEERSG